MSETDNDNKQKGGSLDLGLTRLASRQTSLDVKGYLTELARARIDDGGEFNPDELLLEADKPLPESVAPALTGIDKFDSACAAEDWQAVILAAETIFAENNGENHLVRVWWINAQFSTGGMPSSLLAAPLETAGRSLIENGEPDKATSKFLEKVLVSIADDMREGGEAIRALALYELAIKLEPAHEKTFREVFGSLILYERDRLSKRASRDLRERLGRLEARYADTFGEEFQETTQAVVDKNEIEDDTLDPGEIAPATTLKEHSTNRSSASFLLLLLILMAAAWAGLRDTGAILPINSNGEQSSELDGIGPLAFEYGVPAVKISEPEMIAVIQKPSLNGILQELDRQSQRFDIPDATVKDTSSSVKTSVSVPPPPPRSDKRKQLDMSGPPEPRRVAEIIADTRRQEQVASVAPRIPLQVRTSPLRGESRGNTIVSGYPSIPRFGRGSGGAAVHGEPYFYRIVSETPVHSAPSYGSERIGRLQAGNRVEVGERVGDWLRIISTRSRSGYILADSARPIQNPG